MKVQCPIIGWSLPPFLVAIASRFYDSAKWVFSLKQDKHGSFNFLRIQIPPLKPLTTPHQRNRNTDLIRSWPAIRALFISIKPPLSYDFLRSLSSVRTFRGDIHIYPHFIYWISFLTIRWFICTFSIVWRAWDTLSWEQVNSIWWRRSSGAVQSVGRKLALSRVDYASKSMRDRGSL